MQTRATERGLIQRFVISAAVAAMSLSGLAAAGPPPPSPPPPLICTSTKSPQMAARLSSDIQASLRDRASTTALTVFDPQNDVTCALGPHSRFDSASVVKATILAALLRVARHDEHRHLTPREKQLATAMIEHSDNNAASALWNEIGPARFQSFLNLAGMNETTPGPDGYWGLTQVTADNEMKQLRLLMAGNSVLDDSARAYELNLMANVEADQRWGVSAGTPAGVTVHIKNGWLPRSTRGWRLHSIGTFSGNNRSYAIAVLTDNNPSMAYGIGTVEGAAQVIHRDLNPKNHAAVVPASRPSASWEIPDELVPASPGGQ